VHAAEEHAAEIQQQARGDLEAAQRELEAALDLRAQAERAAPPRGPVAVGGKQEPLVD
jgi:hypothetical protein